MPASAARHAIAHPVQRRTPRVMTRAGSLSVVDPVLREEHDLPTATERMWAALHTFDRDALRDALRFRPDLNERYQLTEQDEVVRGQHDTPPDQDENEPPAEPFPLEHCLKHQRLDLARSLLAAGANPNRFINDRLMVGLAARQHLGFLTLLLEYKVQLDPEVLGRGVAPLHDAVDALSPDAVRVLLYAGAPVNLPPVPQNLATGSRRYHDNTEAPIVAVLRKLTSRPAEEVMEVLLAAGAQVDRVDANGANALHHLKTSDLAWVGRLIALGADPTAEDISGRTPLHNLIPWREQHSPEQVQALNGMARALLSAGADINAQDHNDFTPLWLAVRNNAPLDTLRVLLEAGADPDLGTGHGTTVRIEIERRIVDWNEDNAGYLMQVQAMLVEVEQQRLRAIAESVQTPVAPRRTRNRL